MCSTHGSTVCLCRNVQLWLVVYTVLQRAFIAANAFLFHGYFACFVHATVLSSQNMCIYVLWLCLRFLVWPRCLAVRMLFNPFLCFSFSLASKFGLCGCTRLLLLFWHESPYTILFESAFVSFYWQYSWRAHTCSYARTPVWKCAKTNIGFLAYQSMSTQWDTTNKQLLIPVY